MVQCTFYHNSNTNYTNELIGCRDINQVDSTMDDIREQMDLANEISDAISQPVGLGLDMDEVKAMSYNIVRSHNEQDELAAELDQLEQEELDAKLLETEKVPSTQLPVSPGGVLQSLPGVPSTEPQVAMPPRPSRQQVVEDEDAELAELRASMAM